MCILNLPYPIEFVVHKMYVDKLLTGMEILIKINF